MTKEQAANLPHDRLPGKALAESSSHAETSQQQPGEFPLALSPIDSSSRDLVLTEESLWIRLARQKDAGNTFETRRALRDTYTALAAHYASVGGHEAAVGFLKNALEKADDPQLRHQLARLQGFTIGYDFITTFTHILKSRPYDLKMTLEFCYFLEKRGLHDAALNILETQLKKRVALLTPPDATEASVIDGFLVLLQADISIEQQSRLYDYQQLIAESFPAQIVISLRVPDDTPEETIAGKELEEFESEYGLKDEFNHFGNLLIFFAEHYAVPVCIVIAFLILIGLTLFRIDSKTVEFIGTAFFFILLSFFAFELLRSLRFPEILRLRSHTKVSSNAAVATFAMIILDWLGPKLLGSGAGFFSPLSIKVMSIVLVSAVLWRTYLSMAAIRRSLRKLRSHILNSLTRRAFRRQLAGLVAGTSKWAFILHAVLALQLLSLGTAALSFFAALQMVFLSVCWHHCGLSSIALQKVSNAFPCSPRSRYRYPRPQNADAHLGSTSIARR